MIRIGSSAALHKDMAIGKAVETRYYLKAYSDWIGVSKQAIQNKQYLIVTICVNHNSLEFTYPSDDEWRTAVNDTCKKLKLWGGNRNNCRVSLVNEPLKDKRLTKEQYAHLINLAYPIVKGHGFLCGAGNEEFLTAQAKGDMYPYILQNCMFDVLDIHIQGSCNTPEKTEYWTNIAKDWVTQYGRLIDCPEAFYDDIATSRGWNLIQSQLHHAERIGCPNFLNVFNNMERSAFPNYNTSNWDKLCFNINGHNRSGYWGQWLDLMEAKGPVPNIPEVFEMYGIEINYVKPGSHNEETRAAQRLMLDEGYDLSPYGADSWYGEVTKDAILKWQKDAGLKEDGVVGKNTWQWIFENTDTGMMRFMQMLARTGRYK